jgi:hypothetical protein
LYRASGFVVNASSRLRGELTTLTLKNCKAKVKISFRSTPQVEYDSLLKSVYLAIRGDINVPAPGAASNKSKVEISVMDSGPTGNSNSNPGSSLLLEVQSNDIAALRAAINSYLWLIDASINAYSVSVAARSYKLLSDD